MNISPIAEKTVYLKTADGQQIEVDSLPKNIRFEVETLDRINQKRMDLMGELEILQLAIQAQKGKIGELLKNLSAPKSNLESPGVGVTENA
jgi:hypothetical protein